MEARGLVDRLEAVARLGDHLDVLLAGEQHAEAGADHRLVVGDEDADRHRPVAAEREARAEDEAAPGARARGHLAAVDLDALADADEPVAEAVARRARPSPSSRTSICSSSGAVADGHVRVAGARVLERVGQAFLHDPIGGEIDRAREREGVAVDVQPHRKPGAADLVEQRRRGCRDPAGASSSRSSPSPRIAPRRRRISASAVRPACSTPLSASAVLRERRRGSLCRTAPTWSTITLTAWATMSWSSRAIRARSSATAMRAADSRSRSAWVARSSAASACAARSRSAKPASQAIANRSGMKMNSPARVVRVVVDDDRCRAPRRRPGRCALERRRAGCRAGTRRRCRRRRRRSRTRSAARRRTRAAPPAARARRAPRTGTDGGRAAAARRPRPRVRRTTASCAVLAADRL